MFYSADIPRTSSQEHSLADALRDRSEEVRGKPGSIGVFATKDQVVRTSKDYC